MFKKEHVHYLKTQYPTGVRVTLYNMLGETHMPSGLTGIVRFVDDAGQIHVVWGNGSTLALQPGRDAFSKIE